MIQPHQPGPSNQGREPLKDPRAADTARKGRFDELQTGLRRRFPPLGGCRGPTRVRGEDHRAIRSGRERATSPRSSARYRHRSGIWGIQLAKRGWHVAGVDIVPQALRRARDRAKEAGVDIRLVHGDVTDLRATGIGSGFQLLLDTGTFHGLTPDQEAAAAPICTSPVAIPYTGGALR